METRYEVEPEPVGRTTDRRRPAALVVIALIVVAAVLVKPWDGPNRSAPAVPAVAASLEPVIAVAPPIPRILAARPRASAPAADTTWPSARAPSLLATQSAAEARDALGSLAGHAGGWGVGTAGLGPRMLRDEPWFDWTPAPPEVGGGTPGHIAIRPGTGLCGGYPTIYDRPTFVAITTPRDVALDRVFQGWWTDGGHVATLEGSVVQISPPGDRGIGYLERLDQAPWPPGRYEFHVISGESTVSLTVCLTRRG